jgi:hypothetical protein
VVCSSFINSLLYNGKAAVWFWQARKCIFHIRMLWSAHNHCTFHCSCVQHQVSSFTLSSLGMLMHMSHGIFDHSLKYLYEERSWLCQILWRWSFYSNILFKELTFFSHYYIPVMKYKCFSLIWNAFLYLMIALIIIFFIFFKLVFISYQITSIL